MKYNVEINLKLNYTSGATYFTSLQKQLDTYPDRDTISDLILDEWCSLLYNDDTKGWSITYLVYIEVELDTGSYLWEG